MARFRFNQTCCTSPAAMWFWAVAFAVLYMKKLGVSAAHDGAAEADL